MVKTQTEIVYLITGPGQNYAWMLKQLLADGSISLFKQILNSYQKQEFFTNSLTVF